MIVFNVMHIYIYVYMFVPSLYSIIEADLLYTHIYILYKYFFLKKGIHIQKTQQQIVYIYMFETIYIYIYFVHVYNFLSVILRNLAKTIFRSPISICEENLP